LPRKRPPAASAAPVAAPEPLGVPAGAPEAGSPVAAERLVPNVISATLPVANVGRVPCVRLDTRLTPRQQVALRRLYDGLQADDAQVNAGGCMVPVRNQADAVRWVLDQIADALDLQPRDYLRTV